MSALMNRNYPSASTRGNSTADCRPTDSIVALCDQLSACREVADFPGANNGLQIANSGKVSKIGASVDAGLEPFRLAAAAGVDFLIVHHGLFWNTPTAFTGALYEKLQTAFRADLAVYSCHLPLDANPRIGNNRLLAEAIGLPAAGTFLPYQGVDVGLLAQAPATRDELRQRLLAEFNGRVTALEYGSAAPAVVAILTGSGRSALPYLKAAGTDTLITGELRQEHFNLAQEEGLNLYLCGHYATERYGVRALAAAVAQATGLPHVFLDTGCPL